MSKSECVKTASWALSLPTLVSDSARLRWGLILPRFQVRLLLLAGDLDSCGGLFSSQERQIKSELRKILIEMGPPYLEIFVKDFVK